MCILSQLFFFLIKRVGEEGEEGGREGGQVRKDLDRQQREGRWSFQAGEKVLHTNTKHFSFFPAQLYPLRVVHFQA